MGVVLLIAIVVTMSAVVFFAVQYVAGADRVEESPKVGFTKDDNTRTIQVATAEENLDWYADFTFLGTCNPPLLNGGVFPTASGTQVRAGDVLACGAGETLVIVTTSSSGDAIFYRTTFG